MDITLYTTDCAKCKILEQHLYQLKIKYKKVTDENEIMRQGFMSVPILQIDGELPMGFPEALSFLKHYEGN